MLSNADAGSNLAVKDLKRARQFYEGTLGLTPADVAGEHLVIYHTGAGSRIFVYESPFAGTNQATALTWIVSDVDREAKDLKERGVTFERYDMPHVTHEGDVHVAGGRRVAWFRDPDGNILSIAGGKAAGE